MKIALFIEDGREQLVLTPESGHERALLGKLTDPGASERVLSIYRGSFYACQGGWTRQRDTDDSAIIVLDRKAP